MKKILLAALAAVSIACSAAAEFRAGTEAEFAETVEYALTNKSGFVSQAVLSPASGTYTGSVSRASLERGLMRLKEAGKYPHPHAILHHIRSDFDYYVVPFAHSISNEYPLIAAYVLGSGDPEYGCGAFIQSFPKESRGAAIGELLRIGHITRYEQLASYSDALKRTCARHFKLHLRRIGKSFVTVNGVNPLDEYASRLESILNAPRMHGMAELLKEIGAPETMAIPESAALSDADVKLLCDQVMVDDVKLAGRTAVMLRFSMGTDAYNRFVKEYNEGTGVPSAK